MSVDRRPHTAAMIGAGAVSEYHIKAQRKLGLDVVIFDTDPAQAQRAWERHEGGLTIARTMEEALDRADVVHILTPHKVHAEGALASIARRKPTLIEKPFATRLSDAVEVYRAATDNETPVVIGTSLRLTPSFMAAYEGLQEGDIGDLISLETTYLHDMSTVKAGGAWRRAPDRGSFLYGGGAHAVDLNMRFANQPVTEVQALIGGKEVRPEYPGKEDFVLSLRYADGTIGKVWLNAAVTRPNPGVDLLVDGADGVYQAHSKSPELRVYHKGDEDWETRDVGTRYTMDEQARIFNAFIAGERGDHDPLPGVEEGLRVMIVLHMLEQAAKSGRTEQVPTVEEVLAM